MQIHAFLTTMALAGVISASAIPNDMMSPFDKRATVCSGASGSPVCCATDVLGVADLDCAPPPSQPNNVADFTKICAAIGQRARCCLLPILEQGLICTAPSGS